MSIKLNARKHGLPIALGDKRTLKLSAHSIEIAMTKVVGIEAILQGASLRDGARLAGKQQPDES